MSFPGTDNSSSGSSDDKKKGGKKTPTKRKKKQNSGKNSKNSSKNHKKRKTNHTESSRETRSQKKLREEKERLQQELEEERIKKEKEIKKEQNRKAKLKSERERLRKLKEKRQQQEELKKEQKRKEIEIREQENQKLENIFNMLFKPPQNDLDLRRTNSMNPIFFTYNSDTDEVKSNERVEEETISNFGPQIFKQRDRRTKHIKFTKIFETLDELIEIGETYDPSIHYICNIDMKILHSITESLKELNNMIGMTNFKRSIIDQMVYILTGAYSSSKNPMMHTAIFGTPGTGKTTVCRILAKIYANSGLLSTDKFMCVKRHHFVGKYLGHTAIKTKELLNSIKGGVLFIDEAYSLGPRKSDNDSFAKEAIDTLNAFLSENCDDFICIIAGYKEDIKKCFFGLNQGLERRFTHRYTIEDYSSKEMYEIFNKFVEDEGWKLAEHAIKPSFFEQHKASFPFFGGDIKTFLDKCKVIHCRKFVILDKQEWKTLTKHDIKEGFNVYNSERDIKVADEPQYPNMYI